MRPNDPVAPLLLASVLRDEAPWLEVLAREVCDAMRGRNLARKKKAVRSFRRAFDHITHGPMIEELFEGDEGEHYRIVFHDLERVVDQMCELLAQSGSEE